LDQPFLKVEKTEIKYIIILDNIYYNMTVIMTIYLIGAILCYIVMNISSALNYLNKYQNEYDKFTIEERLFSKDRASALVYGQMNNFISNIILTLC